MMKRVSIVIVALACSAGAAVAGDIAAGEKSFRKCMACHSIGETAKNMIGPAPKRPERTQVRHGAGLQLLGSEQKFRDRLGRSDLQGIHQKSRGKDSGHQNDVCGD